MRFGKILFWVLGILYLSAFPVLRAQEEPVRVILTVLAASNEGSDFNLDNDAHRDKLIQLFSYTAYQQIDQSQVSLNHTEFRTIPLLDGYELGLTLQGQEGKNHLIRALIDKGSEQHLDTVLSIPKGESNRRTGGIGKPGVVFLGGPPTAKGDLVIVVEVQD